MLGLGDQLHFAEDSEPFPGRKVGFVVPRVLGDHGLEVAVALLLSLRKHFVVEIFDQRPELFLFQVQLVDLGHVVLIESRIDAEVVDYQLDGQNSAHLEIMLHVVHELVDEGRRGLERLRLLENVHQAHLEQFRGFYALNQRLHELTLILNDDLLGMDDQVLLETLQKSLQRRRVVLLPQKLAEQGIKPLALRFDLSNFVFFVPLALGHVESQEVYLVGRLLDTHQLLLFNIFEKWAHEFLTQSLQENGQAWDSILSNLRTNIVDQLD